tara:strand:- start:1166 stop:2083 length:918 start_codon:yes stop_codon:yes gene_type:complete
LKVFDNIKDFVKIKKAVVTIGTFDGVHVGHVKILKKLIQKSKEINGESVVITFSPHPRKVIFKDNNLKLLNTDEEKILLLKNIGIDNLIIHPFTKEFSRISSVEFVRDILINKIGTKILIIGYNHQFGRNREGSFDDLLEYSNIFDFKVQKISVEEVDNISVSSTKIRDAIFNGDFEIAGKYLNYEYNFLGLVRKGDRLGRTINFPTANLELMNENKLIPKDGVYYVIVEIEKQQHKGMLNIGFSPTIGKGMKKIEVHIIDLDRDLYDKTIKITFKKWIRLEKKFNDLIELKKQLEIDLKFIKKI